MPELDIWLNGSLVAHAVERRRGSKVVITYNDEGLALSPDGRPLLSCSLPAFPGPAAPAASRAFLEGLLPEGRALEAAAARLRGVTLDTSGAPATPTDSMTLLSEYGRECAGAVVVMPAGQPLPAHSQPSHPLSASDLDALIRNLPTRPLGADLDRDIRLSLAGAQDKLLLTRREGRWYVPVGGYPSTHILKPTTVWPHSAENEALVLALSRACGLSVTEAWVDEIGGTSVLIAERYDRVRVDDRSIVRIHQEDMCQAVGMRPKDKYHMGRPSHLMAAVLRDFADAPGKDTITLFKQVAFRCTVGDEDGHGKNTSLLLRDGTVTIAPLYDTLSTIAFPELSGKMAAPIGTQQSLIKVDRAALLEEAQAMGITHRDAADALDELAVGLRTAAQALPDDFTSGWPADHLIATVVERAHRLETGEPLGEPGIRTRPRHNLDTATAQRYRRTGPGAAPDVPGGPGETAR